MFVSRRATYSSMKKRQPIVSCVIQQQSWHSTAPKTQKKGLDWQSLLSTVNESKSSKVQTVNGMANRAKTDQTRKPSGSAAVSSTNRKKSFDELLSGSKTRDDRINLNERLSPRNNNKRNILEGNALRLKLGGDVGSKKRGNDSDEKEQLMARKTNFNSAKRVPENIIEIEQARNGPSSKAKPQIRSIRIEEGIDYTNENIPRPTMSVDVVDHEGNFRSGVSFDEAVSNKPNGYVTLMLRMEQLEDSPLRSTPMLLKIMSNEQYSKKLEQDQEKKAKQTAMQAEQQVSRGLGMVSRGSNKMRKQAMKLSSTKEVQLTWTISDGDLRGQKANQIQDFFVKYNSVVITLGAKRKKGSSSKPIPMDRRSEIVSYLKRLGESYADLSRTVGSLRDVISLVFVSNQAKMDEQIKASQLETEEDERGEQISSTETAMQTQVADTQASVNARQSGKIARRRRSMDDDLSLSIEDIVAEATKASEMASYELEQKQLEKEKDMRKEELGRNMMFSRMVFKGLQ
ncbi:hypothetical protein V1511DRAFT_504383 [Dipodascopsis uninucleata]